MTIRSSSIQKADGIKPTPNIDDDKSIYSFEEGDKSMKQLLGGKGANLSEMTKLGIPVPFGFTITTKVCETFLKTNNYPENFAEELEQYLNLLEIKMGKKFGDPKDPLLVSVRSGAAISMPGMMDTILNLGLNDDTVEGLIKNTGNERFAFDAYRRFLQMYSDVVLGVSRSLFEAEIDKIKEEEGFKNDVELQASHLRKLVSTFKEIIKTQTGKEFPSEPIAQLKFAIEAVFSSWNNERAIAYRKMSNISGLAGTAVNVQAMVFGNLGEESGTGVAFTRNPSTGEKEFYGEFLQNAQGEDVVAGIRTPLEISALERINKEAFDKLVDVKNILEDHYKDMQDIEFTIERGQLFLLQTRTGKRTAKAAIRIASDLFDEKVITKSEAILRIDPNQLNQLLHPQIKAGSDMKVLTKGLPASPGAASGKVVFDSEQAIELAKEHGEKVILVRKETSPEDITGMNVSKGILTSRGGMTSHAAVVCRGMGKCCIVGCSELMVDEKNNIMKIGDLEIKEGDIITLDGGTGEVFEGEVEMETPDLTTEFKRVMEWADDFRELGVRANADSPEDCKTALEFGAEGIGLCRTEHMFFEDDRIHLIRQAILAKDSNQRSTPLKKLKEIQKQDFVGIFKVMKDKPVVIRLLDPPLHEFLPNEKAKIEAIAKEFSMDSSDLEKVIDSMHEVNPMLGHRGSRLGITFPDIYKMQVQAISEAAIEVSGSVARVHVEIELPLIGMVEELMNLRELVQSTILEYEDEINFDYHIGTMIEIPRACLTADEIAKYADFFTFGTNDLTQLTYGFSRDDVGKFLPDYLEKNILEKNPMAGLDEKGVGRLMQICVELGRKEKENLEIGICGEQGGDPESINYCHQIGLDYVSCSPFRVPIARLAAAQASLRAKM